jgi:hypothetical protein
MREHGLYAECDVAVIGGGLGGVAAALAAAEAGATVLLSEATDWLGGQMTSQGVSALDEHEYIESFGGTRTYYRLRNAIRAFYQERYGAPATMPDGTPLNPGNGWVSRLCFEPRIGVQLIEDMLASHVVAGRLTVLLQHTPVSATVEDNRVTDVVLRSARGDLMRVRAAYFLDATELGNLLPLTDTEYVTGAEAQSDTNEPHASPDGPHPDEVQSLTFCFAVEYRPGEDHTIARPADYEHLRDEQPYTFILRGQQGERRPFRMFAISPEGNLPFWTYRRILDGALLDPSGGLNDVALINWAGNDYHRANLIDKPAEEYARILNEAKRLSLGFLYWLQTEAPRDDGRGYGYPELQLRPDIMGTSDGLSKMPYIRESRRIVALKRIVEQEIVAEGRQGARAEPFEDSVGVGWYYLDLHPAVGNLRSFFEPTLPFQIPLGALIPRRTSNLIAACKNIGTTHLTNGAYRLHPVEWNIGESAGALAAYCCEEGCTPHQVWATGSLLRRFQRRLLVRGVPLAWTTDVPETHECFAPTQMLITLGAIPPGSPRFETLDIRPEAALTGAEATGLLAAGLRLMGKAGSEQGCSRSEPWSERWDTYPDEIATRAEIERTLLAAGLPYAQLGDPPTWGDLCTVFAPLIGQALYTMI